MTPASAMPNGRCRMHGGPTPSAPRRNKNAYKNGLSIRRRPFRAGAGGGDRADCGVSATLELNQPLCDVGNRARTFFPSASHLGLDARFGIRDLALQGEPPVESPALAPPAAGFFFVLAEPQAGNFVKSCKSCRGS